MTAPTTHRKQAFCFSRVWGSHHGGSVYSKRLLDELSSWGWAVTVLAERFEEPVSHGITLKAFFSSNPAAWIFKLYEMAALFSLMNRNEQNLVVVQGDLPRLSYLPLQFMVPLLFIRQDGILACPGNNRFFSKRGAICRRSFGFGCFAVHREEACLNGLSWPHRVGRVGYRIRDRILLRGIKHFVVNSKYVQRAHGRPARVLYPPQLENISLPPQMPRELKRLIFCGRLEPVKGAAQAIEILKLLPPDYHLDVLGEGPERNHLMRLTEGSQLFNRVSFHGWVDAVTRDNALRRAGVLLIPSLWDEAFGMVGLEAFAQGTPVVAYDVGGISEWCRDGAGILVPCGDINQAAVAVLHLTQNPASWLSSSTAARNVAQNQFPPSRFTQELQALLAEVFATPVAHVR